MTPYSIHVEVGLLVAMILAWAAGIVWAARR